jgi:uncharacterized protein (DUF2249 family)/hemerythrin-like domain-containing protein
MASMTETEAYRAILKHHTLLREEVERRVEVLRATSEEPGARPTDGAGYQEAVVGLAGFLDEEVLPHAAAEEQVLYPPAARDQLRTTVDQMVVEHRRLAELTEGLSSAGRASDPVARGADIAALFAEHVARENDVLLPRLLSDDGIDLADLLEQMQQLTEAARGDMLAEEGPAAVTLEETLLSLLLEASDELAGAGRADRACELAAEAWNRLRIPRPDLAPRVTAALHRLVRMATTEPVSFRSAAEGSRQGEDRDLDVRALAPARRHDTIFAAYEELKPGSGFVLVNDHDPKPLRYQFEAEHPGRFTWEYLESGPRTWRVRIGRPGERATR